MEFLGALSDYLAKCLDLSHGMCFVLLPMCASVNLSAVLYLVLTFLPSSLRACDHLCCAFVGRSGE